MLLEEKIKLQTAQKLIIDGNSKLFIATNAKILCKKDLLEAKSMLDMGIATSQSSQEKITFLEKRMTELK